MHFFTYDDLRQTEFCHPILHISQFTSPTSDLETPPGIIHDRLRPYR